MSKLLTLRPGGRGRGAATRITVPEIHEGVSQRQIELLAQRAYLLGQRDGIRETLAEIARAARSLRVEADRQIRRHRAAVEHP